MTKEKDSKGSASSFAKGTIIGAIIGSVTALLFAPKSGKETRKDISDAALKAKSSAEKQLKKTYNDLGVLASKAQKQAEELSGKAKTEYEKLAKKAQYVQAKIKDLISSVREGEVDEKDIDKAIDEAHKTIDELAKKLKSDK